MIWRNYFFYRFVSLTLFFILLSYGLFIIVDVFGHIKGIVDPKTSKELWVIYYLAMLSRRLDILVPFSCGLAATSLIVKAMHENTLIPLMCSGLSLPKFLTPFFTGALLFTFLLIANNEWVYPHATLQHASIVETDFGREKRETRENHLGVIMLQDGQRLFFNTHIPGKQLLLDTFWYISEDSICHVEEIFYSLDESQKIRLQGVEPLIRQKNGVFTKEKRAIEHPLPPLDISLHQVQIATSLPKDLSISNLLSLSQAYGSSKTERATDTKIALYGKIVTPFLCCFTVAIAAIFSITFERKKSPIIPFLASIGFLFVAHIIFQSINILARIRFIPTAIALVIPWGILTYITVRKLRLILYR